MVVGENGILNRATDASQKTNEAKTEEQRQFSMAEAAMNFENTEYEDKNGEKVTIPSGFAVSQVEGENTVEDGLVILDSDGNEFVWIPCGESDVIKYEDVYYGNIGINEEKKGNPGKYWRTQSNYIENQYQYDKDGYGKEGNGDTGWIWIDDGGNIESVKQNGGFYVARYEAGLPESAPFYPNESNNYKYGTDRENIELYVPVSKRNNACWNMITQKSAEILSSKMYETNISVNSQLIDSYAWDTIIEWVKDDSNVGLRLTDSTTYGNYLNSTITIDGLFAEHKFSVIDNTFSTVKASTYINGTKRVDSRDGTKTCNLYEIASGGSENTRIKNIYDLAGNMWEWTTEVGNHNKDIIKESSGAQFGVVRGGGFYDMGNSRQIIYRRGSGKRNEDMSIDIGFRVVLYLK